MKLCRSVFLAACLAALSISCDSETIEDTGEFLEIYPVAVDPLRSEMFQPLLKPDTDGYVTVPDRPGIGYELNMDLLNRYRVG